MRLHHRLIVLLLLLCILPVDLFADDSITIDMKVLDGQTRKELIGVRVTSMTLDSTVIDAQFSYYEKKALVLSNGIGTLNFYKCHVKVPGPGEYILRYELTGYSTLFQKVKIPARELGQRVRRWSAGNVYLLPPTVKLGEAKVQASKILMVMKGDTLVYNADVLRMAAGTMLENLISELPGVQLDPHGQIFVNGRKVESLLLNGKDFFRGDPLVALQNLPSYMVDKVKVYDKAGDDAYLKKMGGSSEYVMDVHLKKQYSIGWIGNIEAGYGTEDRYLARALGIRFSDRSRISVFGNLNNLNDTRIPGSNGTWTTGNEVTSGLQTLRSGGLDLLIDGSEDRGELLSSLKARHEDTDTRSVTTRTNYYASGDTYSRSRNTGKRRYTEMTWNNRFKLKTRRAYFQLTPNVTYTRTKKDGSRQSASFNENPDDAYRGESLDSLFSPTGSERLNQFLANRSEDLTRGDVETWKADGHLLISLPTLFWISPDYVTVWGNFNRKDEQNFSRSDIRYGANFINRPDFRNRYETKPSVAHNWGTRLSVNARAVGPDHCLFNWNLEYAYEQSYASDDRAIYRLDHYDRWNTPTGADFGTLPSTRDSLQQVLDGPNSYHTPWRSRVHTPQFYGHLKTEKWGELHVTLKAVAQRDWLLDRRNGTEQEKSRRFFALHPWISYNLRNFRFHYDYSRAAAPMNYQLDVRDDTNPLLVWVGNPDLKDTRKHALSASWGKTRNNERYNDYGGLNLAYNLYLAAIGQAVTYDRTLGTSTTQPRNIDGNWDATLTGNYGRTLDKARRLTLGTNTSLTYRNSVDFAWATGDRGNGRSSVRNLGITENLSGTYRFKNANLSAHAQATWAYATSPRADFATMSSVDFQYGLKTTIHLPWDLEIATDITMYSRRGYDDASMNTDDLVWNLRLSKSMLPKRNLVLSLDGFDILGQLSNVRRVVNSQGRTETWYNTVPRYFMARIAYRLNIAPKKNKTIGNKTTDN